MNDQSSQERLKRPRRSWVGFGEIIGLVAVVISGLGLWKSWNTDDKPTRIVEQRQPIALTLRGKVQDGGQLLEISPVESSHALQSLTITIPGTSRTIEVGSDGELRASDVQEALGKAADHGKDVHRLPIRIVTHYVEAGSDKRANGAYVLSYRWESGGLFGGHSLRLVGISKG